MNKQKEMQTINIFYSWQSDLSRRTNQDAIRHALEICRSSLETTSFERKINIQIDEATRGISGSPNIPQTIMEKIRSSDVFVADITTVNKGSLEDPKTTPNPNVLFELGYAVGCLGWNRILMLFNKAFGDFPNDTPFDIDRHRAYPYKLSVSDAGKKGAPPTKKLFGNYRVKPNDSA
jgi:hypothetical protein